MLDPGIFDGVWQTAEQVELIAHTLRQTLIHPLVHRLLVHQIEHIHLVTRLTEALDAANALLQLGRVPWQIDIDQRTQGLQIQPLAGGISRDHDADFMLGYQRLERFTLHRIALTKVIQARLTSPRIQANLLLCVTCGKLLRQPAGRVVVLTEQDAAALQPLLFFQVVEYPAIRR